MSRFILSCAVVALVTGCFKPIYDGGLFPDGGRGGGSGGGGGSPGGSGGGDGGSVAGTGGGTAATGGGGGTTAGMGGGNGGGGGGTGGGNVRSDGGSDTALEPGFYGTSEGYGQVYPFAADAGNWQPSYRIPTDGFISAIWSSGPNDVWLVGSPSLLLHFNGSKWVSHDNDVAEKFGAIWGTGPNDVWVVSDSWVNASIVIHWNGLKWKRATVPGSGRLTSVWGSGANDVWIGGAGVGGDAGMPSLAPLFHWNGSSWAYAATLDSPGFVGGWSSGPTDSYALSVTGVYHLSGANWTVTGTFDQPRGIWASAPNDVWVAQAYGPIRRTANSVTWTSAVHDQFYATWIGGTNVTDIWSAGQSGKVRHRGSDGIWKSIDSAEDITFLGGAMVAPGDPWLIDDHSVRRGSF